MKLFQTTFTFLYFFAIVNASHAQVQIENLSFNNALKKAKKEDKILMVIVDSKSCDRCNEVAKQGLANEKAFAINKLAVTIELTANDPDWENVGKKYFKAAESPFGTLFFSNEGILIHRFDKSTTNGNMYLAEVNTAMQNVNTPNEIIKLETAVATNHFNDLKQLNELLQKRKSINEPTDDLMERFINTAPADSFKSVEYLKTLVRFSPILHTKADSILRLNKFFYRSWISIEPKEQILINLEIYKKTFAQAVATKDYLLASILADFNTNASNNPNRETQSNTRNYRLANFYKAVNDTSEYLRFGSLFIEGNLMRWNPDSLKKFYLRREEAALTIQHVEAPIPFITYTSSLQGAANTLNTFAWNYYKMSSDSNDLKKALTWAKRGLIYFVSPELLDTYAQLLYVTGEHEEAILQEQKVIEEKKKANREKDIPITERILARMKRGDAKVAE